MPRQISPREIDGKSAEEVASIFLTAHDGVQRSAEVACWEQANRFQNDNDPAKKFWLQVIHAVVFGGEYPKVERREVVATPSFSSGLEELDLSEAVYKEDL